MKLSLLETFKMGKKKGVIICISVYIVVQVVIIIGVGAAFSWFGFTKEDFGLGKRSDEITTTITTTKPISTNEESMSNHKIFTERLDDQMSKVNIEGVPPFKVKTNSFLEDNPDWKNSFNPPTTFNIPPTPPPFDVNTFSDFRPKASEIEMGTPTARFKRRV